MLWKSRPEPGGGLPRGSYRGAITSPKPLPKQTKPADAGAANGPPSHLRAAARATAGLFPRASSSWSLVISATEPASGTGAHTGNDSGRPGPAQALAEAGTAGVGHPRVAAGQNHQPARLGGSSQLIARYRPVAEADGRQERVVAPEDAVGRDMDHVGVVHGRFGGGDVGVVALKDADAPGPFPMGQFPMGPFLADGLGLLLAVVQGRPDQDEHFGIRPGGHGRRTRGAQQRAGRCGYDQRGVGELRQERPRCRQHGPVGNDDHLTGGREAEGGKDEILDGAAGAGQCPQRRVGGVHDERGTERQA